MGDVGGALGIIIGALLTAAILVGGVAARMAARVPGPFWQNWRAMLGPTLQATAPLAGGVLLGLVGWHELDRRGWDALPISRDLAVIGLVLVGVGALVAVLRHARTAPAELHAALTSGDDHERRLAQYMLLRLSVITVSGFGLMTVSAIVSGKVLEAVVSAAILWGAVYAARWVHLRYGTFDLLVR